jgi:histone-lysine N-methyltransferase SETMAR
MPWNVLPRPLYSPDLTPSDFHLFGPLRDVLRGRRFADDVELNHSVREDLRRFSKEFYTTDVQRLTQMWKKCVDNEEDFM